MVRTHDIFADNGEIKEKRRRRRKPNEWVNWRELNLGQQPEALLGDLLVALLVGHLDMLWVQLL